MSSPTEEVFLATNTKIEPPPETRRTIPRPQDEESGTATSNAPEILPSSEPETPTPNPACPEQTSTPHPQSPDLLPAHKTFTGKTQDPTARQLTASQQQAGVQLATTQQAAIHQLTATRARRYIEKIPPAVSGENGHAQTFSVAVALLHGFALPTHEAWPILADYNTRCVPPWTPEELHHKLQSAFRLTHHPKPRGHLVETTQGRHFILRHPRAPEPKPLKPLGRVRKPEIPSARYALPDGSPPGETYPPSPPPTVLSPTPHPRFAPHPTPVPGPPPLRLEPNPGPPSAPIQDTLPFLAPALTSPLPAPPPKLPSSATPETLLAVALEHARLHLMNIPTPCCPICWVFRRRSLWIGNCVCTGSFPGYERVKVG